MPIQYPADRPANPTDSPEARCKNPLENSMLERHGRVSIRVDLSVRVQAVFLIRRWAHVSGDENCDDEGIDCNNTSHDNRNKRLLRPISKCQFNIP